MAKTMDDALLEQKLSSEEFIFAVRKRLEEELNGI